MLLGVFVVVVAASAQSYPVIEVMVMSMCPVVVPALVTTTFGTPKKTCKSFNILAACEAILAFNKITEGVKNCFPFWSNRNVLVNIDVTGGTKGALDVNNLHVLF